MPGLLAELLDDAEREPAALTDDVLRCGRILAAVDPDEVQARHPGTPAVTVALTGHSTVTPLGDPLTAELARHGLLTRLVTGDHGGYLRDLTDPDSTLRRARPELTLCVLEADAVFGALPAPWDVPDVEQACARLLERLSAVAAAHTAHGTGALVLTTLPLPARHPRRLVGLGRRALLGAVWREFNARLLRLTADHPGLHVVDLDPLIAAQGPATDTRLELYARTAFGPQLFAALAREAGHIVRARRGMTKKCLVLDLDRTLWDGILSEDGPDGIAPGGDARGEPYAALQRTAGQLSAQGVLLAVSSKNDEAAVLDVLRGHPDMLLRPEDFVRINANWEPKDGNLRDIAARLGIAADALVLADDSAAERALIRRHLPGTPVVPLSADEPALHVERLLADGWFDTPHTTADDRHRTVQYRRAAAREELREHTGSYEDYLRELELEVRIAPPAPRELDRLAQLSLRTNQFNLTGERLPPDAVAALAARPDALLLAVHLRDRFGDSGLVGALFARTGADGLHIDNMLLSCRALARGVEQGALAALLHHAKEQGMPRVRARYRPTRANGRVRDLYPSLGFTEESDEKSTGESTGEPAGEPAAADDTPDGLRFAHDLAELPPVPAHLRLRACFTPAGPDEGESA